MTEQQAAQLLALLKGIGSVLSNIMIILSVLTGAVFGMSISVGKLVP